MSGNNALDQLNERQREAVMAVDGPVLVIAGAGSGKTRVLTERIVYLLREHRVSPWEILAFTFTNKAAREMRDRLERSVPGAAETMWVGTFHATGVRILRRHGEGIGIKRDFSIYDSDDSLNVVKAILSRNVMDAHLFKSPRQLRDIISRFKNDLISPEMALERAGMTRDQRVALLYAEYDKELRRASALDFDDLIAKVVELFTVDDDAREVYARRFRYILVDEFQDTNPIQMAMIDALQSVHHNLFVVGDDDQSIYSWRGARVEHILDFEHLYPNTKLIRLEQNYRSTQTILDAANAVIANNKGRKGKNLWTDGGVGEKVHLIASIDEEGEAVRVVDIVRKMRDEHGIPLKEIAVLYRTNAQSRALEDVLKMSSMPYQIIGSVKFYERMEVRDVLAWCKILVNPDDGVNLRRIINVPRRGIGKTSIERLEMAALERGVSVIEMLQTGDGGLTGAAAKRVGDFLALYRKLQEIVTSEVAGYAVEKIVEELGYFDYLEETQSDSDSRVENVEEFISAAHAYAEGAEDKSLRGFLEEVALVADVDSLDTESGMLTLMTLHNAKGLEFQCVIITGLEDGLFPHFNSMDDTAALEEERRLFYVGMTRSKMYLYLSFAAMRRRMGQVEDGVASRFLHEVPEACLTEPIEQVSLSALSRYGTSSAYGTGGATTRWQPRTPGLFRDDTPQQMPDYENDSQEALPGYQVGMRVRHDQFGGGTVRRVEGSGEQLRVTVIFDTGTERKFLARFAPMRPSQGS